VPLACAMSPRVSSREERIVFLGDSITDGFTYPLLLRQALAEAGRTPPVAINAGIAGDTAEGMVARLERDVLPHRPTLVSLSVGINDILRGVTQEDYERRVTAIAARMELARVPMLIMTTTPLGKKHAEADARLAGYNAFLRRLAQKHGYRLAEVNATMRQARDAGQEVLEADNVHISFAGYRVMVRALLDALGHTGVPVPAEQKLELLPGVVRKWKLRTVPDKQPELDAATAAGLEPDASWTDYTLPEAEPLPHWWHDQERRRGFAMSLETKVGAARRYQGVAVVEAERIRDVVFLPGASLQTIWLNGRRIYKSEGWRGWHPGRESVVGRLRAGRNVVVIETGPQFFLSITREGPVSE